MDISGKTVYFVYDDNRTLLSEYGIEGSVLTSGDDNDTKHLFNNGGYEQSEHADGSWTLEQGTIVDDSAPGPGTYLAQFQWDDDTVHPHTPPEAGSSDDGEPTRSATVKLVSVEIEEIDFVGLGAECSVSANVEPTVNGSDNDSCYDWFTSGEVVFLVDGQEKTTAKGRTITLKGNRTSKFYDFGGISVHFRSLSDDLGRKVLVNDGETLTVVDAELKNLTFTSDHGSLRDNDQDWTGSGELYGEPEWELSSGTNYPISQTMGTFMRANAVVLVKPYSTSFKLIADAPHEYTDFSSESQTALGSDQQVFLCSDSPLPTQIDILEESIQWKVRFLHSGSNYDVGVGISGPHSIYLTYDTPTSLRLTRKRIEWACSAAKAISNQHAIVRSMQERVQISPPYFDGGTGFRYNFPEKSPWEMLAVATPTPGPPVSYWNQGDCYDHALLIETLAEALGVACSPGRIFASCDDGNAWEEQDYHPDHSDWLLKFSATPGFNNWEGAVRLDEKGTWYYYTSVPDLRYSHTSVLAGSIGLLRLYASCWSNGVPVEQRQEYYLGASATGVYEPLPPAP